MQAGHFSALLRPKHMRLTLGDLLSELPLALQVNCFGELQHGGHDISMLEVKSSVRLPTIWI